MAESDKVAPARREHVLAVAAELGYRPHTLARSLATGTSHMVGVVVPNLSNPYFYDIIRGIGRASAEDGYQMVVADSMEDPRQELTLVAELLRYVDALVLVAPRAELAEVGRMNAGAKPVVTLIGPTAHTPLPHVSVDNFAGMMLVHQHLADLGHRRVAYLAGPQHSSQDALRVAAGQRAATLGITVEVIAAGGSIEAGRAVTDAALATGATALACFNDLVALGVLHRLSELDVAVPGRISVTGFDDIDFSAYSAPALTSVRTPREELGRQGWGVVRAAIEGDSPDPPAALPAELVVRGSTGPAASA